MATAPGRDRRSVDLLTALEIRDGVATFTELTDSDVRPVDIARALAANVVVRPHRGVYVLPDRWAPFAAAKRLGGAVSHQTAAEFHRLELLARPTDQHVTVPRGRRKTKLSGVTTHRRDLGSLDVDDRWPVTSPLRTCLDCMRALPLREAVVVGDSALRAGLVTEDQLLAEASRLRGNGSATARAAAALLDPRAESVLESAARVEMHLAGLPVPQTQVVVTTPLGERRLDFLVDGVGVETDGFATHGSRSGLLLDCLRHNGYAMADLLVMRFGWEHVVGNPRYFTDTVAMALEVVAAREVPQCRACGGRVLPPAA